MSRTSPLDVVNLVFPTVTDELIDVALAFPPSPYPRGSHDIDDFIYYKHDIRHGVLAENGKHLLMSLGVKEAQATWENVQLQDEVTLREFLTSKKSGFLQRLGKELGIASNARQKMLAAIGATLFEDAPVRLLQQSILRRLIRAFLPVIRSSLVVVKTYEAIDPPDVTALFPSFEDSILASGNEVNCSFMCDVQAYFVDNELPLFPPVSEEYDTIARRRETSGSEVLEQEGDIIWFNLVHGAMMREAYDWEIGEYVTIMWFLISNLFQAHLLHQVGRSYADIIPTLASTTPVFKIVKSGGDLFEALNGALARLQQDDKLQNFANKVLPPVIRVCRQSFLSMKVGIQNPTLLAIRASAPSVPVYSVKKRKRGAASSLPEEQSSGSASSMNGSKRPRLVPNPSRAQATTAMNSVGNKTR